MPDYAPGVPMWIDVSSTDLDKTNAFYSGLFGWDAQQVPDPAAGGYTMYSLNGQTVGAGAPTFTPDQPPAWSQYVHSVDAYATVQAVKSAGGNVVAEPMQVMDQGKVAVFQDPTGAFIGIWQPQVHTGAQLVNAPGAFSWSELYTRDLPTAVNFYRKIFGWDTEETEMPGLGTYTLFKADGKSIAGGLDMTKMLPESVPPHWLIYFTVENTGDSIAKAKELGGTINMGPQDTPMGPMAVIADPVGAVFAIIQINQQS